MTFFINMYDYEEEYDSVYWMKYIGKWTAVFYIIISYVQIWMIVIILPLFLDSSVSHISFLIPVVISSFAVSQPPTFKFYSVHLNIINNHTLLKMYGCKHTTLWPSLITFYWYSSFTYLPYQSFFDPISTAESMTPQFYFHDLLATVSLKVQLKITWFIAVINHFVYIFSFFVVCPSAGKNQPLIKLTFVYSISAPCQLNEAGEIHTTLLTGSTLNYDQKANCVSLDSSFSYSQGEHFVSFLPLQMQYTEPSSSLAADLSSYVIETIKTIKESFLLFSVFGLPISVSVFCLFFY